MAAVNRWLLGARPRTLPAAVVPVALGAAAAVGEPSPVWWRAGLALLVSLALQVGVNYANDYSDGVRGTDEVRVGPTRLVASGLASAKSVKMAAFAAFGVAAVAGLVLAVATSWWLLVVGAAAIAAAWFYFKPLPPGIAKQIDPALARQLPYYPGYEWRQYGTDAVLVEVGTTVVREVLRDILR